MKRIVLCPNPMRDVGLIHANLIKDRLKDAGAKPEVYPLLYVSEERTEPVGEELENLHRAIRDADLLICLGGDGTILHLARVAAPYEIPILTINLGRKGFIAELEPKDMDKIIEIATAEHYRIEQRMMLDVKVRRQGQIICEEYALNDAVARGATRLIDMEVYADNQLITKFSGDGIIVSAPTGSTAYSMAAGGPIIEPTARNLTITPLCAHALTAKSFVLAPDKTVTVKVTLAGEKKGYLSVDGGTFKLEDGDELIVTQSKHITRIVKASERSFYQILNEKLGEME